MMRVVAAAVLFSTTNAAAQVLQSSSGTSNPSSTSDSTVSPSTENEVGRSRKNKNNSNSNASTSTNNNAPLRISNHPGQRLSRLHPLTLANTTAEGCSNSDHSCNENTHDDTADVDIGILSSRELVGGGAGPFEKKRSLGKTKTSAFDLFRVFDREQTNFNFLCDPGDGDTNENDGNGNNNDSIYFCSTCQRLGGENGFGFTDTIGKVGSFDCQMPPPSSSSSPSNANTNANANTNHCYEIDSRCPNNIMTVCHSDTLRRTMKSADAIVGDEQPSSAYVSERCRRVETTLTKTNRELYDDEESFWEFSYCMRYNISSPALLFEEGTYGGNGDGDGINTCELEVDGVVCSSCRLETVDRMLDTTTKDFCGIFDCGNTVLGYSGRFCNLPNTLAKGAVDYFVYRSLPCDGGCNLCGVYNNANATTSTSTSTTEGHASSTVDTKGSTMMMMKFRESNFVVVDDDERSESISIAKETAAETATATRSCFDTQWKALIGPTDDLYCEKAQSAVQKSCGCIPMTTTTMSGDHANTLDAMGFSFSSTDKSDTTSTTSGTTKRAPVKNLAATALTIGLVAALATGTW
eukprot:jgi/Psemu1/60862/gm1.60862_g